MRRRSLRTQLILGAIVALLVLLAVPVVFLAGRDGIDAVESGDGSTAIERLLVALVAVAVPVIAMAAYAHWLWVTSRPQQPHREHIPSPTEKVLLGAAVAAVAIAAWPVAELSVVSARPRCAVGGAPLQRERRRHRPPATRRRRPRRSARRCRRG